MKRRKRKEVYNEEKGEKMGIALLYAALDVDSVRFKVV